MEPKLIITRSLKELAEFAYENDINRDEYLDMFAESVANQIRKANKETIKCAQDILAEAIANTQAKRDLHDSANVILQRMSPRESPAFKRPGEDDPNKKPTSERFDPFYERINDLMVAMLKATDEKAPDKKD